MEVRRPLPPSVAPCSPKRPRRRWRAPRRSPRAGRAWSTAAPGPATSPTTPIRRSSGSPPAPPPRASGCSSSAAPAAAATTPRMRLYLADTTPPGAHTTLVTVAGPNDLLDLPLPPLGERLPGRPVADPLLLVCTHGRRDRCCALDGRALVEGPHRRGRAGRLGVQPPVRPPVRPDGAGPAHRLPLRPPRRRHRRARAEGRRDGRGRNRAAAAAGRPSPPPGRWPTSPCAKPSTSAAPMRSRSPERPCTAAAGTRRGAWRCGSG